MPTTTAPDRQRPSGQYALVFRRKRRVKPRYYLYLSKTKVDMLYPQIPSRLLRSLDAEVKATVGVVQATVRGNLRPIDPDLYARAQVVASYLTRHVDVGSVARPSGYVHDVASVRYGIVWNYAAEIAFFGGLVASTRLGLIGASDSMVGEPGRAESRHALDFYALSFLRGISDREPAASEQPQLSGPNFNYSEAYEAALEATRSAETKVEFLGRLLHQEDDLLMVAPIYVALAD